MKKIDLMLMLFFFTGLASVSYGQVLYPGGLTCPEAVPITVGEYSTPADGFTDFDHWYTFVAPCDGNLTICNGGPNEMDKRIYSGTCDALTLEASANWNITCTPTYAMTAGEECFINVDDSWDGVGQFDVNFVNPACPEVNSLDAIATDFDEAILAWFAGGSETDWIVCYGPTGFDPETEGTIITVSGSPSTTLTGLSELTCYDYYVQADCGGGEVSCFKTGPETFCTPAICPTPLNPIETGVTNTETTLDWDAGGAETDWEVQWGLEGFVLDDALIEEVAAFSEFPLMDLDPATCYDWYVRAECIVDIGEGPETFYSLWVGPNEWCTDANCLTPSNGIMVASGGLNATLSWDENNTPPADEWNIQYGAPGFTLGEGTTVTNIPTNPYTLGGLEPGTDYCFYVQAVCGEGEDSLSLWAGPYCFTTDVFCPAPSSLFAEGTSGTEADLEWTPGDVEEAWDVSWGPGITDPMDGTMEDAAVFPSLTLTGLTPGEEYCFFVRANCGETEDPDSSSAFMGPFCWTQPALCEAPFSVEAINITNTAAQLNYTAPGFESVEVQVGLPCFEWDGAGAVISEDGIEDDPYYMTGLEESTPYWAYIQATCGVDSVSSVVGPVLFGTDISNDDPCDAEELTIDAGAVLRHNFGATILPGEGVLAPPASGCTDSDGWCGADGVDRTVWFKFTAPASGQAEITTFDESECITNFHTEIAVYSTGDCGIFDNYTLEYANTLDPGAFQPPYGSTIVACGLTPGEEYYIMVNPISYISTDVHFGIAVNSVEEVAAGLGLSPTICAGSDYDLFDAIAGFSTEDGTWYNPTVAPGNELGNLVTFPDAVGSFDLFYVVSNGCDSDTVMTVISTVESVTAGEDGFYTTCNDYDIILSDHIGGLYEGGGIWEYDGVDPDVALAGGLFAPLGMDAGEYKFNYTVTSEYCPTDTSTVTIILIDCTDLDENAQEELVVYPNPVVDELTVQNIAIDGNAVIEVLDIEGRVIFSKNVSNVFGNYTIDMSDIESGVYLVRVTAEDSVQKVRVVKQ